MNLTSSHPFWSVSNGISENYPSLQHNVSCDAVVIGGGITGALVELHLTEAGVKTVVIDKRRDALISQKSRTLVKKVQAAVSRSPVGSRLYLGRHFR